VAQKTANAAMLFYAAAYSIATITSFVVMLLLSYKFDDDDISNFKGLAKKQPLLGVAVTVAMLSLAGIPPTAGFFGKYYLFTQAIQAGYTGLVIIAILGSLISIVYYFRVIINMYAPEDSSKEVLFDMPLAYKVVLIISTALTAALGLFPDLLAGII
jgi:NADH-quinone oxidoreductase subunit N